MAVRVSRALYRELNTIKESGEVNLQDCRAVLEYAEKHGLLLAARTVRGNPRRYLECVNDGMDVAEQEGTQPG